MLIRLYEKKPRKTDTPEYDYQDNGLQGPIGFIVLKNHIKRSFASNMILLGSTCLCAAG